jgi:hypothetical protein
MPRKGSWDTMEALVDAPSNNEQYHRQTYSSAWLRVAKNHETAGDTVSTKQ